MVVELKMKKFLFNSDKYAQLKCVGVTNQNRFFIYGL